MTETDFRSAALAALALGAGLASSSAFAQDRFATPFDGGAAHARPVAGNEDAAVPPNVRGHFTCTFSEVHGRLERKGCAGTHCRS